MEGALETRVTRPKRDGKGDHRIPFLRVDDTKQKDVRGHGEGDQVWSVQDARDRHVALKTKE